MDISAGEIVCPGKEVTFTCVARGSGIITWTSDEYIGNPIDFNSRDMPGETRRSSVDSNTIATFIESNLEEGNTLVLVSTLQITVSSVSLTPSVTCIHNRSENFTFQVLGMDLVMSVSVVHFHITFSIHNVTLYFIGSPINTFL